MAPDFRRYTQFVALSKHSLWALVAIIIGIVVWIASREEPGERVVFSHIPKSGTLENIMDKPHYQGVDTKNQPFTIIADKATQLDKNNVALEHIRADMQLGDGKWVALEAGSGRLNLETKQMELQDRVSIFYEGGYEFSSNSAYVDIRQGAAHGMDPVEGQGPPGTLTAKGFSITNHGEHIVFNGSVTMKLYH